MATRRNGLLKRACKCVGHLLEFVPIEGWGWYGAGMPAPFEARLLEIVERDGCRIGGVASVETDEHPFCGWFVEFRTRHVGTYDFVGKTGAYVIWLSDDPSMAAGPTGGRVEQRVPCCRRPEPRDGPSGFQRACHAVMPFVEPDNAGTGGGTNEVEDQFGVPRLFESGIGEREWG